MATPSINQRIVLTGADEVRRHLEEIGKAGERSGNQTRTALLAATQGTNSFTSGSKAAGASSRQMGAAMTQLSFQVNDVVTSLASGINPMQTFAQQGGQIFQVFQQGGITIGGVATAIRNMITPARLAGGAVVAAGAGLGVLISRAADAESSVRQFDVVLKGMVRTTKELRGGAGVNLVEPRGFGITAKALEESAKKLRDAGLNINEARQALLDAVRAGVDPARAEQIVRIGQNLNAVLGDGSADKFAKAVAEGVEPLRKIAVQLRIVAADSTPARDGLRTVADFIRVIGATVKDADVNTLSQFGKAARSASVAWADFLNSLSPAGVAGAQALNVMLTAATALAQFNFAGLAEGMKAAFEPLKNIAIAAFDAIRARLAAPDPLGITALATAAATSVQQLFVTLGQTAMDTLVNAFSSIDPFAPLVARAQSAVANIQSMLQSLLSFAQRVGSAVGGLLSAPGMAVIPAPGFAAGGQVRGPGTGTSDSIVSRLSNGEFIVNAVATRMNLPLLQAINSMRMSVMPRMRMPRGFAAGGLVAAGGGGTPIYLTIPGGSTMGPMMADSAVTAAVMREGRRATMLSAGRKPSSVGGRRYGG